MYFYINMTEGPVCFHTKVNQLLKKRLNMRRSPELYVGKVFFFFFFLTGFVNVLSYKSICTSTQLTENKKKLKCMNDGVDFICTSTIQLSRCLKLDKRCPSPYFPPPAPKKQLNLIVYFDPTNVVFCLVCVSCFIFSLQWHLCSRLWNKVYIMKFGVFCKFYDCRFYCFGLTSIT